MDSVIITKSIKRRQGRRIWYAICFEKLFCLFTCSCCNKINTVKLSASFSVKAFSGEEAMLKMMKETQPEVLKQLKKPGPKKGDFLRYAGGVCRCVYCHQPAVWVTEDLKGNERQNKEALLAILTIFPGMPLGVLIARLFTDFSTSAGTAVFVLLLLLPILIAIVKALWVKSRIWEQADMKIENAIGDCPPLYGDTPEEVVSQARACAPYADADIWKDMKWEDRANWQDQTDLNRP